MYYFVRSCVRWGLLFICLCLGAFACSKMEFGVSDVPDCEYFHYPCPWDTTVPDPYFDPTAEIGG
jgi:hypothetical protein